MRLNIIETGRGPIKIYSYTEWGGIFWGSSMGEHYETFTINNKYGCIIGSGSLDNNASTFTTLNYDDIPINEDFNKITIRKIDDYYAYFINEQFIYYDSYKPIQGDLYLGFQSPVNTKIQIDWIKYSEIL